jgi:lysophospholipase L1-like esterase
MKTTPLLKGFIISFLVIALSSCKKDSENNKIKVLNRGINSNNSFDLIDRLDKDVISQSPDLVIIMIGTNDMDNPYKYVDLVQYVINVTQIVTDIKRNGIQVLLLSPPPGCKETIAGFDNYNAKIDTLNAALKLISQQTDCLYNDLNMAFKDAVPNYGFNTLIAANYIDAYGVHPTKKGYTLIGSNTYNFLRNQTVKYHTIVCFGDSITYGYTMKGAGTTTGDTYPATLSKLINNSNY